MLAGQELAIRALRQLSHFRLGFEFRFRFGLSLKVSELEAFGAGVFWAESNALIQFTHAGSRRSLRFTVLGVHCKKYTTPNN